MFRFLAVFPKTGCNITIPKRILQQFSAFPEFKWTLPSDRKILISIEVNAIS